MILKIINKCFLIISRNFWIFLNRIRLYSLRIKYGNNCNLFNSVYLRNEGCISIGDNFLLTSGGGRPKT